MQTQAVPLMEEDLIKTIEFVTKKRREELIEELKVYWSKRSK